MYINTNYVFGRLSANDKFSSGNAKRNLSFFTSIHDANFTIEGDVFDISGKMPATLYFFAGAGIHHFNPYAFDTLNNKVFLQPLGTEGQGLPQYPDRKMYSLTQFNIPFGAGIKYAFSPQFIAAFEIGFRKLFSDYLDDVSTTYPQQIALLNGRGPLAVDMSFRSDELKPPLAYRDDDKRGNPGKKDTYYFCVFKLIYGLQTDNGNGYKFSRGTRRQSGCPAKVL